MKIISLIAVAGAIGALCRFGAVESIRMLSPHFPYSTLIVNVLGSFLAGFLFIWCRAKFSAYEVYFPVLFIGFLGAFTTFSTFTLESVRMLYDAQYLRFGWNVVLMNVAGLGAAGAGLYLSRHIFHYFH